MFNDTIFDTWLDTKANEIIVAMGNGSALTPEQMMVLVLKAQTNHFNHLDIDLRTDMKDLREDLTADMKNLREDLTSDMKTLREDLTSDMKTLREDLTADMKNLREDMDKRFEKVDKRLESMITRMDSMMIWMFATTLTVGGIVIAATKYLLAAA
jgi:ElaB/YqjD/DUF883 family membrane-anchored ribosome-binding protein